MKTVRVVFENKDIITTSINGTKNEILDYYKKGTTFNLGCVADNLTKVLSCTFIGK